MLSKNDQYNINNYKELYMIKWLKNIWYSLFPENYLLLKE